MGHIDLDERLAPYSVRQAGALAEALRQAQVGCSRLQAGRILLGLALHGGDSDKAYEAVQRMLDDIDELGASLANLGALVHR